MLRVTLEQWRMFRSVVQFGGFNQASQGIHKSQSSIHNAVGKIESSLDVKLFGIEGRKTVLTEAGELMLKRANFLLDEAAKLEVVGQTLGQGTEASLRIAVDEMFPQLLLYKVLENVSAQYPMLQIELIESILSGASELLNNADVDIAISPVALIKDTKLSYSPVIIATSLKLYKLISALSAPASIVADNVLPPPKDESPAKGSFKGNGSSPLISELIFAWASACFFFTSLLISFA